MGAFLSPKASAPPPPPPPTRDDAAVRQAAFDERQRRRLAAGRASTIKTGPQGVTADASVRKKTLLGE